MLPLLNKEPVAVAAAIVAVLNVLQITGVVSFTADAVSAINIALVAVLGLFVRQASTPISSPTLAAGTSVKVQGSEDSVIVQKSPPGPVGVEGGDTATIGAPTYPNQPTGPIG